MRYHWYDNEKRDGRSQMMKGNGTMADLTPKAHACSSFLYYMELI